MDQYKQATSHGIGPMHAMVPANSMVNTPCASCTTSSGNAAPARVVLMMATDLAWMARAARLNANARAEARSRLDESMHGN